MRHSLHSWGRQFWFNFLNAEITKTNLDRRRQRRAQVTARNLILAARFNTFLTREQARNARWYIYVARAKTRNASGWISIKSRKMVNYHFELYLSLDPMFLIIENLPSAIDRSIYEFYTTESGCDRKGTNLYSFLVVSCLTLTRDYRLAAEKWKQS